MDITLRPVTKKDYKFLYDLLQQRNPKESISHREMPAYDEHIRFNNTKPYKVDYIICTGSIPIGRLYITPASEIGIKVMNKIREPVIRELLRIVLDNFTYRFCFNISPNDKLFKTILKEFKFKKIMETYESLP